MWPEFCLGTRLIPIRFTVLYFKHCADTMSVGCFANNIISQTLTQSQCIQHTSLFHFSFHLWVYMYVGHLKYRALQWTSLSTLNNWPKTWAHESKLMHTVFLQRFLIAVYIMLCKGENHKAYNNYVICLWEEYSMPMWTVLTCHSYFVLQVII